MQMSQLHVGVHGCGINFLNICRLSLGTRSVTKVDLISKPASNKTDLC